VGFDVFECELFMNFRNFFDLEGLGDLVQNIHPHVSNRLILIREFDLELGIFEFSQLTANGQLRTDIHRELLLQAIPLEVVEVV